MNPILKYVSASPIREITDWFDTFGDITLLTIGEPDMDTPRHIVDASIRALENGETHYSNSRGDSEFRRACSDYIRRTQGLNYDYKNEVLISIGVTEGLAATLMTLTQKNDAVIVPEPYYPAYETISTFANLQFVTIDTEKTNLRLTPEALNETLKNTPNAKVLILNYPSNPTGVSYNASDLEAFSEIIKNYPDLVVISDEIYSTINYTDEPHTSFAKFLPERTVLLNGLSKSFAMTGWRLGYIMAPQMYIDQIFKVHQLLVNNATRFAELGGVEALDNGDESAEAIKNVFNRRRTVLLAECQKYGFEYVEPNGAFYLFLKIPDNFKQTSVDFCKGIADRYKFGFVPGEYFGKSGERYIRISYAIDEETLKQAIRSIHDFVDNML